MTLAKVNRLTPRKYITTPLPPLSPSFHFIQFNSEASGPSCTSIEGNTRLRDSIRAATRLPPGPDDDELVAEYVRFLQMIGSAKVPIGPSAPVDDVWHAHMQYTRHYATYCKRQLGRYLHHDPTDDKASGSTMYQRTLITCVRCLSVV